MFRLGGPSCEAGTSLPIRLGCDDGDVSPALSWSAPPAATCSFALVMEDLDAPNGGFVHWLLWNIPGDVRELPEGCPQLAELKSPAGARQGVNGFLQTGYSAPCPPDGQVRRYLFRLYALDTLLDLEPGADRAGFEQAVRDHVLATAEQRASYLRLAAV